MTNNPLIMLLKNEPSLRYKLEIDVLGLNSQVSASETVRDSKIAQTLINTCMPDGNLPYHPYKKWIGAHWVLSLLADLGYPPGDEQIRPLVEQAYQWILGSDHARHIREINSRIRRCASQEGNLIYSTLKLGLADERTEELISRLIKWQWEDGGWNCDKRPEVSISSFMESLIPLRALALAAKHTGHEKAKAASFKAADIFLKRFLFKRLSDGRIIDHHFIKLHYPCYWHYDILFALKVMAECGLIDDPRCQPALDLLESQRLPDDGFPATERYYQTTRPNISNYSPINWGGVSKKKMNPFVTVDSLSVLKAAGREISVLG